MQTECCPICRKKLGKMGSEKWMVKGIEHVARRWRCSACKTVTRNPEMREETGIEERRRERLEHYQALQDEVDKRNAQKKVAEKVIEKPVVRINPLDEINDSIARLNRRVI